MARIPRQTFTCANCAQQVSMLAPGTKNRNHCPVCLYSLHVDVLPGDRRSTCGGLMAPIGRVIKSSGETALVHKCTTCGFKRINRIAGDDSFSAETLPLLSDGVA